MVHEEMENRHVRCDVASTRKCILSPSATSLTSDVPAVVPRDGKKATGERKTLLLASPLPGERLVYRADSVLQSLK